MIKQKALRIVMMSLLAGGIILAVLFRDQFSLERLEAFVASLGWWGPVVFILLWLVAPLLMLPGSPLTLVGGVLFGPFWGTVYTIFGATGGATLAFLAARYLAGDWVEKRATGMMGRIKAGVEEEGWTFLAFTRLVPLFPFNVLNYAFGLTRIPLGIYMATSFVCMLPGSAGYTYLGYAGREAVAGGEDLVRKGLLALAVFGALFLLPIIVRRLRAAGKNE